MGMDASANDLCSGTLADGGVVTLFDSVFGSIESILSRIIVHTVTSPSWHSRGIYKNHHTTGGKSLFGEADILWYVPDSRPDAAPNQLDS
jgi:hypothetical protein